MEGDGWRDEGNRSEDEWRSEGMEERENAIQIERCPCGLASCFHFTFVLILGVVGRGRNIRRLWSHRRV